MASILAVGIATIDIINTVERYPGEDDEVRAIRQEIRRGGNATNTLLVLSQFGHDCWWAGSLAEDLYRSTILGELDSHSISTRYAKSHPAARTPLSCVTLSEDSGMRSIVHYRDLPEFSLDDFLAIDLGPFRWIHFEGRNVEQTTAMLRHARQNKPSAVLSVEIEKVRPGIEALAQHADHVLYSRPYALAQGFGHARDFLQRQIQNYPDRVHYCSWGTQGAYAIDGRHTLYEQPAFPPAQVVDTLGAGDTFNAGIIDACLRGADVQEALLRACQLAGRKCGQAGLQGLA